MKQLQLARPTVFIMLGYPGSGKSTFARHFAETVNAVHLSSDRIRHELYGEPQFTKEENDVVFRVMHYMYEALISQGVSVIFDANNNRRAQRMRLKEVANNNDADYLVIWVQTDVDTSFKRASSRDRRKTDDKYSYDVPKDVFERMKNALAKPKFEDYVVISGKHVYRNQLQSVLKKLPKPGATAENGKRTRPISLGGRVDLKRRRIRP